MKRKKMNLNKEGEEEGSENSINEQN